MSECAEVCEQYFIREVKFKNKPQKIGKYSNYLLLDIKPPQNTHKSFLLLMILQFEHGSGRQVCPCSTSVRGPSGTGKSTSIVV